MEVFSEIVDYVTYPLWELYNFSKLQLEHNKSSVGNGPKSQLDNLIYCEIESIYRVIKIP